MSNPDADSPLPTVHFSHTRAAEVLPAPPNLYAQDVLIVPIIYVLYLYYSFYWQISKIYFSQLPRIERIVFAMYASKVLYPS